MVTIEHSFKIGDVVAHRGLPLVIFAVDQYGFECRGACGAVSFSNASTPSAALEIVTETLAMLSK
jgi:hypothetical protein